MLLLASAHKNEQGLAAGWPAGVHMA